MIMQTREYNMFERWTDAPLEAYLNPAMSGYQRVSMNREIRRADLQLFRVAMKATREGIRMRSDVSFPVEEEIELAMKQPEDLSLAEDISC